MVLVECENMISVSISNKYLDSKIKISHCKYSDLSISYWLMTMVIITEPQNFKICIEKI
jgi:hypothetical protein